MFDLGILAMLPSAASGDRIPHGGPAALSGLLEAGSEQWAACAGSAFADVEREVGQGLGVGFDQEQYPSIR